MSTNGDRRPPRPRLSVVAPGASPEEAAAIAAALEQFMADTAPRVKPGVPAPSPWLRAALEEGVGRSQLWG